MSSQDEEESSGESQSDEKEESQSSEKAGAHSSENESIRHSPSSKSSSESDSPSSKSTSPSNKSISRSFSSDSTVEDKANTAPRKKKLKRREHAPGYHDEILPEFPDRDAYRGPQVNWTVLSGRKWANESFLKYLPHPEVSNLIGWAHYGTTASSIIEGGGKPKAVDPKTTQPNPLLEVESAGPLPLSHLDYLQEKARDLVRGKQENPRVSEAEGRDSSYEPILERFDTSASVALGMVLEEMITANLIPLAERHVQRCRKLEQEGEEQASKAVLLSNHEKASFHEWTLPPEEAIFNVLASSLSPNSATDMDPGSGRGRGLLPSTFPPSRTIVPSPEEEEDHVTDEPNPKQQAAIIFCQRQGLKSRFVRNNMDVYQWFLPTAPPQLEDEGPKKRKKTQK